MKTWLQRLLGLVAVMQAGIVWAGDSPWTLRLGASYRAFDDIAFNAVEFRNWGRENILGGPAGVQNITVLPQYLTINDGFVVLDYVRWNGSLEGDDSRGQLAPVIGFGYDLTPVGKVRLALVGHLQYYHMNLASDASGATGAPGTFTLKPYQHWWWDWVLPADTIGDTVSAGQPYTDPPFVTTTFAVTNRFEMTVYVLDFGLEARMAVAERINITLALGPSLTIVNAESRQRQEASWGDQGLPWDRSVPQDSYIQETSESSLDFLPGGYVALGVTYDFSESWSLGLEYRYDYVSGEAGTAQAELDLSGSSGIIRLGYRF